MGDPDDRHADHPTPLMDGALGRADEEAVLCLCEVRGAAVTGDVQLGHLPDLLVRPLDLRQERGEVWDRGEGVSGREG
jgi:hypothetical protein